MTLPEKECIVELKNGSKEAFELLYNNYASKLYGFVFSLTKSSYLADEVVQETFVKIWLNRSQILPELSFKAYLFMIAKNHVINVFRKQSLIYSLEESDAQLEIISSKENNTEQLVELNELKIYIEKAKFYLSPRQREIFELSKEQGFSNQQIAEKLQISNQSVKNQLSSSLRVLKSHFNSQLFALLPLITFLLNEKSDL